MKEFKIKQARPYETEEGWEVDYDFYLDAEEIGYAHLIKYPQGIYYLEYMEVDEAYRNQGYGSKALQLLVNDIGSFYLSPDSQAAQRLYARWGQAVQVPGLPHYDFGIYRISL